MYIQQIDYVLALHGMDQLGTSTFIEVYVDYSTMERGIAMKFNTVLQRPTIIIITRLSRTCTGFVSGIDGP